MEKTYSNLLPHDTKLLFPVKLGNGRHKSNDPDRSNDMSYIYVIYSYRPSHISIPFVLAIAFQRLEGINFRANHLN